MTTISSNVCQQTLTVFINANTFRTQSGNWEVHTMGTVVRGCQPMLGIPLKCPQLEFKRLSGTCSQNAESGLQASWSLSLPIPTADWGPGKPEGARWGWTRPGCFAPVHRGVSLCWPAQASQPSLLNIESTKFLLQLNSRERKHFGSYSGKVNVYSFSFPLLVSVL